MNVLNMDCIEGMRMFPPDTFDAIVTDPPYELGFMGKAWDSTGIAFRADTWREALRILKPGGHLLAFSGSRTYHRMACAIEDAGFAIRDQIMWLYGSGFPKSHNVSKAIDKAAGKLGEREVVGRYQPPGMDKPWNLKNASDERDVDVFASSRNNLDITAPATDAARQWDGWGTALKPAHEPIVVARKPLVGTVAENVLAHGVGALNIDGCRVPTDEKLGGGHCTVGQQMSGGWERPWMNDKDAVTANADRAKSAVEKAEMLGRWPANVLHDGLADEWARFFYCPKASKRDRDEGLMSLTAQISQGADALRDGGRPSEMRRNTHPTVKPTELMRYLCRLVTPPNGCILDPFAGSGSTGKAATLEGFTFIGFELDQHYCDIANTRIRAVQGAA